MILHQSQCYWGGASTWGIPLRKIGIILHGRCWLEPTSHWSGVGGLRPACGPGFNTHPLPSGQLLAVSRGLSNAPAVPSTSQPCAGVSAVLLRAGTIRKGRAVSVAQPGPYQLPWFTACSYTWGFWHPADAEIPSMVQLPPSQLVGAAVTVALDWSCSVPFLDLLSAGQKPTFCHCVLGLSQSHFPTFLLLPIHGGLLSGRSQQLAFSEWSARTPAPSRAAHQSPGNDARCSLASSYLCYQIHAAPQPRVFICGSEEGLTVPPIRIISCEPRSSAHFAHWLC